MRTAKLDTYTRVAVLVGSVSSRVSLQVCAKLSSVLIGEPKLEYNESALCSNSMKISVHEEGIEILVGFDVFLSGFILVSESRITGNDCNRTVSNANTKPKHVLSQQNR
ncbi:hypothetical protein AHF37_03569 [Paragonimus kellicotti]|nr:hypothetical protein AHF37_03569 [Paragonimus kellicotti]